MSSNDLGQTLVCSEPSAFTRSVEDDVQLAAMNHLPVLISASLRVSEEIACALDRRSRPAGGCIVGFHCGWPGVIRSVTRLLGDGCPDAVGFCTLLLQEVHALSLADQSVLEEVIESLFLLSFRANVRFRIVASSSVPLFERLVRGEFLERLYYLLSMVHIVVPHELESLDKPF